ncbi:uncharacterized protein LOC119719953 [Patiria miniata]|uniref:Uncharacterized protein n=1 Tax=Patiria miniata TaxID=46514 RepID=A0A913Z124_PATMI|nr:uncharacterized protein LOC119719953 [Patiria miniata]
MDRFGDSDIHVPSLNIAGMPDWSGLTASDRFAMNESALLQLHRSNLKAFKDLMFLVKLDEDLSNSPKDFGANFSIISARLVRVVAMIEAVMGYQGYFQDGFPAPSTVSMTPTDNEMVRNIRDLYVLQELYSYLSVAHYDLYLWYGRHSYDMLTSH